MSNSVYSSNDQLSERIRQLRSVIQRSEKHGHYAHEQITRLRRVVTSLEALLSKQYAG